MIKNTLKGRVDRIELQRTPPPREEMVIWPEDGESMEAAGRRAAGRPVIVAPKPCLSTDEWLARFSPAGRQ